MCVCVGAERYKDRSTPQRLAEERESISLAGERERGLVGGEKDGFNSRKRGLVGGEKLFFFSRDSHQAQSTSCSCRTGFRTSGVFF